MRLIDADECEKYFYDHMTDNAMAGAMNAIDEMPTIEPCMAVASRNAVQKLMPAVKAEISGLVSDNPEEDYQYGYNDALMKALQIIDKYIESEV